MNTSRVAASFVIGLLLGFSIYGYHFLLHPYVKTAAVREPPPDYLTIKGEAWNVFSYDFDKLSWVAKNTNGFTECKERNIFYDPNRFTTQVEYREVIWHEIVHAEHCGVTEDSTEVANWNEFTKDLPEHAGVYELGMFLPGFVHDNPDFMKWAEDWK